MTHKASVASLAKAFSQLTARIRIFSDDGQCLYPENGQPFSRAGELEPGALLQAEGQAYLMTRTQPALILSAEGTQTDLLHLADALAENLLSRAEEQSAQAALRRILTETLSPPDSASLCEDAGIDPELHHCILLFRILQAGPAGAYGLLLDTVPLAAGDCLVELDRHTVALVKDLSLLEDAEELEQFAQAVAETLLTETGRQAVISMGAPRQTLAEASESYREACRALEVGVIFKPQQRVHEFNRLMLERFLTEVPRDVSLHYHSLLFNRKTARLLNEEMLNTIDMFFKKDLNLSDTARQLYIHRNTLVYRLDKVQKQTGLDLRRFEDALTFKVLMELKKCGSDPNAAIH